MDIIGYDLNLLTSSKDCKNICKAQYGMSCYQAGFLDPPADLNIFNSAPGALFDRPLDYCRCSNRLWGQCLDGWRGNQVINPVYSVNNFWWG